MPALLRNLINTSAGLLKGLGITGRNLYRTIVLRQAITITEKWGARPIPARYRGVIGLTTDLESGRENCIGCMACMRICPDHCIHIETEKRDGHRGRYPVRFIVDLSLCSFCGLCVEACPTPSLIHTHLWQLGGYSRADLILNKDQLLHWGDAEQERRGDAEIWTGKKSQQRRATKQARADKSKGD